VAFAPASETIPTSILSIDDLPHTSGNPSAIAESVAANTARVLDWGLGVPSNFQAPPPPPLRVGADVAADVARDDVINASRSPAAPYGPARVYNPLPAPLRAAADAVPPAATPT
jgi:hypothetical protein